MNAAIDEWLAKVKIKQCWLCPQLSYDYLNKIDVHHIERRSHAKKDRYDTPENFFLTCTKCHISTLDTMSHALQLAYKKKYDPEHYDLEKWLRIRDPDLRAPDRVTPEDVGNYFV